MPCLWISCFDNIFVRWHGPWFRWSFARNHCISSQIRIDIMNVAKFHIFLMILFAVHFHHHYATLIIPNMVVSMWYKILEYFFPFSFIPHRCCFYVSSSFLSIDLSNTHVFSTSPVSNFFFFLIFDCISSYVLSECSFYVSAQWMWYRLQTRVWQKVKLSR